jgi:uncharacterized membrane protein YuzA (DUF378 family)|tara:strand:+ start:7 stop:171 length:165 start_codon:yes stop_codon:yes gene_type:complete
MGEVINSDSLKVFGLNIGTMGVWMVDWIPFVLQTVSSILFIIYMIYKIKQLRRK